MKRHFVFFLIFVLLFTVLFVSPGFSEEKKKEKIVKLSSNTLKYNKDKDRLIAQGNVKIIQEDVTIVANKADFNMKDKTGIITGNVMLTKKDIAISGNKMIADFNKKLYQFEGDVILTQKRKDKQGKEEEVKWFCKGLTINGDKKDLKAEGGVHIERKDLKIDADSAQYFDKEQKIVLEGHVYIDQNNGEKWIKGDHGVIYLEEEDFEVTGNVKSGFKLGD